MTQTKKELQEVYNHFISNLSNNLDEMCRLLRQEKLTFSFEEIEKSYIIYSNHYKNPKKINKSTGELEHIIYAYWGEAFKHYNGGEWVLNISKTDEAYGTPTIEKWGGEDYPWSRISPKVWKIRLENQILGNPEKVFGK